MNERKVIAILLYYSFTALMFCEAGYLSRIVERGIEKAGWTDKTPYADIVTQKKFISYHVRKKQTITDEMVNLEKLVCKGIGMKLAIKFHEIIPATARNVTIRIPPDDFYPFQKTQIERNAKIPKEKQLPLANFQSFTWLYEPKYCRYFYSQTTIASYFYIAAGPMEARHTRGYFLLLPSKISPDDYVLVDYVLFYLHRFSRTKKYEIIFDTSDSAFNPDWELLISSITFAPNTKLNVPRQPLNLSKSDKNVKDDIRPPSHSVFKEKKSPSKVVDIQTGSSSRVFEDNSVIKFDKSNRSPYRVGGKKHSPNTEETRTNQKTRDNNYGNNGTPIILEYNERKPANANAKSRISSKRGSSSNHSPETRTGDPVLSVNEKRSLASTEEKADSSNESKKDNPVSDVSTKNRQGIPSSVRKMRECASSSKSSSSLRSTSPKNSDCRNNDPQRRNKNIECEMDELPEALKTTSLLPVVIKDTELTKPLSRSSDNIRTSRKTIVSLAPSQPNINPPPIRQPNICSKSSRRHRGSSSRKE